MIMNFTLKVSCLQSNTGFTGVVEGLKSHRQRQFFFLNCQEGNSLLQGDEIVVIFPGKCLLLQCYMCSELVIKMLLGKYCHLENVYCFGHLFPLER